MTEANQTRAETPIDVLLSRSLAFFLPGFVDSAHLGVVQSDAVHRADYAGITSRTPRPDGLSTGDMTGFEESLQEVGTIVGQNTGELGLVVPARLSKSIGLERLSAYVRGDRKGSFGADREIEEMVAMVIPSVKITAVQALPYPVMEGHFEPRLNIRIQTPNDPPLTMIGSKGRVEVPSPGRWHGLPLRDILLSKSF